MAISKTLKASLEKKTIDKIDEAKGEVEELLQDLRNKFDDKSEKWQQGDKGEALSDQITNIGEAMDDLDGAMDKLRNFRDSD